jgi:chemotaxis protein CheY-P-specific phosphatase CheC
LNIKQTSINRILELWNTLNTRIFSIHLTFSGELSGQCILVIESDMAYALIDMITNSPAGTTRVLDDAEAAVVGEMGNIIGPLLFNEIVTMCRIASQPNPSIVLYDTAEALHEIAAVEMVSDNTPIYILETAVLKEKNRRDSTFSIMLNPDIISSNLTNTDLLRSIT